VVPAPAPAAPHPLYLFVMAARLPDLLPTPEEFSDPSDAEHRTGNGLLPRSRSGFNLHLHERLLTCGNQGALDQDPRMGRRPSVVSLSAGDDESSFFHVLRRVRIAEVL
jgi:hypothetical protein